MNRKQRVARIGELTSLLFDEGLHGEQKEELNSLLRGDPETCEVYLAMAEAHAALLHDHAAEEITVPGEFVSHSSHAVSFPGARRANPRWIALSAAALVFLFLNLGLLWFLGDDSGIEPQAEGEWIAVVTRVVDAEWTDRTTYSEGDGLFPGEFHLDSGLAHIEFFSGASVIVEGPAHLSLESAWKMACHQGKLRTFVPEPAQGFTIVTPEYHAVDLGTEFALRVEPGGRSELLVVNGEVRIDDDSGAPLEHVLTGEGISSLEGRREKLDGDDSDYVSREALMEIALADAEARYRSWCNLRDRLAGDPDTLVLFDFEDQKPWDRELKNRVPGGPDGAIIGAKWGGGRWSEKEGLHLQRITDRIRLRIPGEFHALSFSTWVQVNGLDQWLSSLMLTDGFDDREVHWQLSDQGELILGIASPDRQPNVISPAVIGPKDLGRWIHLAVTVDHLSGEVVHYLDGQPVIREVRSSIPPLRLGDAEIGNWRSEGKNHPLRSLNGTLDEFLVMKRVLSPDEVREIYETGRRG